MGAVALRQHRVGHRAALEHRLGHRLQWRRLRPRDLGEQDEEGVIWGTARPGTNIVWGTGIARRTRASATSCGARTAAGTSCGARTVAGTSVGYEWPREHRVGHKVSGTNGRGNIVWGTNGRGNIMWGTNGRGNIVWGTNGRPNIVWGTGMRRTRASATSCGGRPSVIPSWPSCSRRRFSNGQDADDPADQSGTGLAGASLDWRLARRPPGVDGRPIILREMQTADAPSLRYGVVSPGGNVAFISAPPDSPPMRSPRFIAARAPPAPTPGCERVLSEVTAQGIQRTPIGLVQLRIASIRNFEHYPSGALQSDPEFWGTGLFQEVASPLSRVRRSVRWVFIWASRPGLP